MKYGIVPIFDVRCKKNVIISGYEFDDDFFAENKSELWEKIEKLEKKLKNNEYKDMFEKMKKKAAKEKEILYNKLFEILN
jgi:hypothetical protein